LVVKYGLIHPFARRPPTRAIFTPGPRKASKNIPRVNADAALRGSVADAL
jgi:hypothetical protein